MSSVLLMSGGIDSTCLAFWLRPALCITVDYGQRAAKAEIAASENVCSALGLNQRSIKVDISALGSGNMVGDADSPHSPNTEFWPFRNQFLVTLAAMIAIQQRHLTVLIGSVSSDTRHADGKSAFRSAFNELLAQQEGSIRVEAPAGDMTTRELITASDIPMDVLGWAHSCHTGNLACGRCPGCNKHSLTMQSLGVSR